MAEIFLALCITMGLLVLTDWVSVRLGLPPRRSRPLAPPPRHGPRGKGGSPR